MTDDSGDSVPRASAEVAPLPAASAGPRAVPAAIFLFACSAGLFVLCLLDFLGFLPLPVSVWLCVLPLAAIPGLVVAGRPSASAGSRASQGPDTPFVAVLGTLWAVMALELVATLYHRKAFPLERFSLASDPPVSAAHLLGAVWVQLLLFGPFFAVAGAAVLAGLAAARGAVEGRDAFAGPACAAGLVGVAVACLAHSVALPALGLVPLTILAIGGMGAARLFLLRPPCVARAVKVALVFALAFIPDLDRAHFAYAMPASLRRTVPGLHGLSKDALDTEWWLARRGANGSSPALDSGLPRRAVADFPAPTKNFDVENVVCAPLDPAARRPAALLGLLGAPAAILAALALLWRRHRRPGADGEPGLSAGAFVILAGASALAGEALVLALFSWTYRRLPPLPVRADAVFEMATGFLGVAALGAALPSTRNRPFLWLALAAGVVDFLAVFPRDGVGSLLVLLPLGLGVGQLVRDVVALRGGRHDLVLASLVAGALLGVLLAATTPVLKGFLSYDRTAVSLFLAAAFAGSAARAMERAGRFGGDGPRLPPVGPVPGGVVVPPLRPQPPAK
ncbi:MAG: hypothetical protein HYZ53_08755 [Planctomycetes bacterium]|nr:hypothetical protein [Planctomycetota bacterium]